MITFLLILIILIILYFFYRNFKYNNYLKTLKYEHFSMNKNNKLSLVKEIPSNPILVFCDNYGNFILIKENKITTLDNNGNLISSNKNINDVYKIPYSTNIKSGTIFKKFLIILTNENDIFEYDLLENELTKDNINSYFDGLNIEEQIEHILYMEPNFYLFSKDILFIYDKENNKIEKKLINTVFKNYPKNFSTVFINNNILYKNISHGAPCFFRNNDVFIYDLKSKDTYFSSLKTGLIKNTEYTKVPYVENKITYNFDDSGYYRIICVGAGLESGGYGGFVFNDYNFKKNEKIVICVGGSGERLPLMDSDIIQNKLPFTSSSAGSGGTFIYKNNKLLMCAGGGGGWSSELIKAPNICNSSFRFPKVFNKLVIPIKKMVFKTKNKSFYSENNVKQKLIIKSLKINSYNYNNIDYEIKENPKVSSKKYLFETHYNNINDNCSISFDFEKPLSDYNFKINCKVLATNNEKNDCDLHIFDEQGRELIINNFIEKFNDVNVNSRKIISLFVKYPNTLNDFYVSSGNKTSKKYNDLFENVDVNALDYPLSKLNGGIGGGGFSYINRGKKMIACGGGGGYKGGTYTGLYEKENDYIRKFLNIDYICGIGGLSFIQNPKFNESFFINDYNNKDGFVYIIKINELQKLEKVNNSSYLQKEKPINNLNTVNLFFKNNKYTNKFDFSVPSINNNLLFDKKNILFFSKNQKITKGINYYKIKLNKNKYDRVKIYIKCNKYFELLLMYFSSKTFNRYMIKEKNMKKDNILSLNHGLIDPSIINIFSFVEKLIKQNIYSFKGNIKNKKALFENREFVYEKTKEIIIDLNIRNIIDSDYLYILINSFEICNLKINLVQYNSQNISIKQDNLEYQIKHI